MYFTISSVYNTHYSVAMLYVSRCEPLACLSKVTSTQIETKKIGCFNRFLSNFTTVDQNLVLQKENIDRVL